MIEDDFTAEICISFVKLDQGGIFKGKDWSMVEVYEGRNQGWVVNPLMKDVIWLLFGWVTLN